MTRDPRTRRPWVVALAVVLAVLVVSCGISTDDAASEIDPQDVPFGLLEAEPTTTIADEGRTVTAYMLSGGRLIPVERTIPEDGDLDDLIGQVEAGPTESERRLGLTSALPQGAIASVATSRGEAQVDLAASFGDMRSSDQLFAIGQIVYTLTDQPGIGGVTFTLDDESIEAPRTGGTANDAPISRDDFAAISPR